MSFNISKYFWDLNDKELSEVKDILRNPYHQKFAPRAISLLSRCDRPQELFSLISKEKFIEFWPVIQAAWRKAGQNQDFRNWWQTLYEQMIENKGISKKTIKGESSVIFLKIGRMIRSARINKGMSQAELALKTGMKQPDISKIEEGRKNITLKTIIFLCKILEIKEIDVSQ